MAEVMKPVRLVNPGRKKRLTLKQKLFFGSKRQRTAAKAAMGSRRNPSTNRKYRKAVKSGNYAKAMHYNKSQTRRYGIKKARATGQYKQAMSDRYFYPKERLPNVGEIITIRPLISNGPNSTIRKKRSNYITNMAKSKKRRSISHSAAVRRARKAARTRARHSSARRNPGTVTHHRRRRYARRNPAPVARRRRAYRPLVHIRRHRRNPGMMAGGGDFSKALQIIGGAMVTSFATSMLPAGISTGIPGYIATALVAMLQGKAIGKLTRNAALGNNMAIGGYVYLALKIAKDYFPSLGLPFSLNGLGVIGGSSFYQPQVPLANNMGSFVLPGMERGAIPAAAPAAGMRGLGNQRRVGRMR